MRIGVVGGGAWGTALAQVAAARGEPVLLWAREHEVVTAINEEHCNRLFLPGVPLSPAIRACEDVGDLRQCDMLLMATPAQHLRGILGDIREGPLLVLCAKGLEADSGSLMSGVAAEVHPGADVAVLSGPTFAAEVANGLPTAVTIACRDKATGRAISERLARPSFRPYQTDDVIGAEIGGAVKNVLAIACGVAAGRGLGENARAALIARGFVEMARFGIAMGARAETLSGLSGLGDLVLTCSSSASRNFTLGEGLGQGQSATTLMHARRSVAEGAFTAPILRKVARAMDVDMPVVDAVCQLLDGAAVAEIIDTLLARPLSHEG